MNRDREIAARMLETAREMVELARRGQFRADPVLVERIHLRAIFFAESAERLSPGFKSRYPSMWKTVQRFRNLVVHEYLLVDPDDLWKFIRDDLPATVSLLRKARFPKNAIDELASH